MLSLGGGRRRAEDSIDHGVGLSEIAGLGDTVGPERPLALVHARSESEAEDAARRLRAAFEVGPTSSAPGPTVHETLGV